MLADAANETCVPSERFAERSEGLKTFSVVFICFLVVFVTLNLVLWRIRRKTAALVSRRIPILLFAVFAVGTQVLTNALVRASGPVLPCWLHETLEFTYSVYAISPVLVRLNLWINSVTLNWYIAQTIVKPSSSKGVEQDKELARLRFKASSTYGIALVLASYIPPTAVAAAVTVLGGLCENEECAPFVNNNNSFIYVNGTYLLFTGLLISLVAYYFFKYRTVPDLVGIWKESLRLCLFVFVGGLGFTLLRTIDPGDISQIDPIPFEWKMLVDFMMLGYFVLLFTVPLLASMKVPRIPVSSGDFREILDTEAGARFFKLYTATELTLENFLFYQRATKWKESFGNQDIVYLVREAEAIADLFIRSTGDFELNIPASVRTPILSQIDDLDGGCPDMDLFEEAVGEVFILMLTNSYQRFRQSTFYRLYIGQLDKSSLDWVLKTGIASEVEFPGVLATDL